MNDIFRNIPEDNKKDRAWLIGLICIGYITISMILGNSGDVDESMIQQISPIFLLVAQGVFSIFLFIVPPIIITKVGLHTKVSSYFQGIPLPALAYTLFITIGFMVAGSAIAEWNMNIDFPGNSGWEQWARSSEEKLKIATEYFTTFTSTGHFILALIVIAIIPAIGEELLFRGLIQNSLTKALSNPHLGIWISAFIFSAIHLQFFGFFPRFLLGALFGYLYYWSGRLSVAMVGHLINNGLAVTAIYLSQQEIINIPQEEMEQAAPWPAVLLFAAFTAYGLNRFKTLFFKHYE